MARHSEIVRKMDEFDWNMYTLAERLIEAELEKEVLELEIKDHVCGE